VSAFLVFRVGVLTKRWLTAEDGPVRMASIRRSSYREALTMMRTSDFMQTVASTAKQTASAVAASAANTVANAAKSLGMHVIGCDPYITIDGAWHLSRAIHKAGTYDEIFEQCDYITLHVPATPQTKNMINKDSIAKMKDGVRILNLSRADLVNIADLKEALASGKVASYVTDFPTEESINVKGIVAIPHLGASTEESEDNCAVMAASEIIDFLENGNIKNSVNYPNVSMPRTADHRVVILHKNIPNMISHISGSLAEQNINIENLVNSSKGDFACTIAETNSDLTDSVLANISAMEGIIRVIKIA